MEHPKDVGDRSTLAIMAALRELGYATYVPFGENTRVDLVIEKNGHLLRVQCKTGRLRSGTVRFNTCSSYAHHAAPKITRRTYAGEIDLFAVYCPQTGSISCLSSMSRRSARQCCAWNPPATTSASASASPRTTRSAAFSSSAGRS